MLATQSQSYFDRWGETQIQGVQELGFLDCLRDWVSTMLHLKAGCPKSIIRISIRTSLIGGGDVQERNARYAEVGIIFLVNGISSQSCR